jgi:hypothetical protein
VVLERSSSPGLGDDLDGGFDAAGALANVANASKSLVEELFGEALAAAVGAAGSGFGLIVVARSVAL